MAHRTPPDKLGTWSSHGKRIDLGQIVGTTLKTACQVCELLEASKEARSVGEKWESRMSMEIPHREWGNSSFRVQDCRIWSEIAYLDSPTDYREVLPRQVRPGLAECNELVILDPPKVPLGKDISRPLVFFVGITAILIAGYVLYLVLDIL